MEERDCFMSFYCPLFAVSSCLKLFLACCRSFQTLIYRSRLFLALYNSFQIVPGRCLFYSVWIITLSCFFPQSVERKLELIGTYYKLYKNVLLSLQICIYIDNICHKTGQIKQYLSQK